MRPMVTQLLGGVPIAIKDVINVKGDPCTCLLENFAGLHRAV